MIAPPPTRVAVVTAKLAETVRERASGAGIFVARRLHPSTADLPRRPTGARRPRAALAALGLVIGCAGPDFPEDAAEAPACQTVVVDAEFATTNLDLVDVLFVVDDGPSMVEEQETLRRELPRLVETLVTNAQMAYPFPVDFHVGIVSADMGAPGAPSEELTSCTYWGQDGLLQHAPRAETCADDYPLFLSFHTAPPLGGAPDPQQPGAFAADFACIAGFGTSGCAYAQPLEAALKALWPSVDIDRESGDVIEPNRVLFLGDAMRSGELGHGDRHNGGFLRNDPREGLSLVSIVVVTDKDDCSAADSSGFRDPLVDETSEARCAANEDLLYRLERYVDGLRALREGVEHLVTFSAITGVPLDLVSTDDAGPRLDFSDAPSRDAYYDAMFRDPRMQYAQQADGTLAPACMTPAGRATPARRLVEVARGFGDNGRVHSICSDDWSSALDHVLQTNGHGLGSVCFPRVLRRDANGLTDCDVVWELPAPGMAPPGTPESCDEVPNLLTLHTPRPVHERGGFVCDVNQLAVTGAPDAPTAAPGYGWYYDDFSNDVQQDCSRATPQMISFSEGAKPPSGVVTRIECRETRYLFPASGDRAFVGGADVFEACNPASPDACDRFLLGDELGRPPTGIDRALYCHPTRLECVPACTAGACPEGWRCNDDVPAWCEPLECRVPG